MELVADPNLHLSDSTLPRKTVVVCRLGNDSQTAAAALTAALHKRTPDCDPICDIIGGLRAWSKDVDPNFPVY